MTSTAMALNIELSKVQDKTITLTTRTGMQRTGTVVRISEIFIVLATQQGLSFITPTQVAIVDVPGD